MFFTDADMLEMMHRDTNANLYPMHTYFFLNQCIVSLHFADAQMQISDTEHPNWYWLQVAKWAN